MPDNQLSLAIGKKGQNARLAVKLTNHRIDIKSQSEMQELGIDYQAIADEMHAEYEAKKAAERAYKQQQRIEELKADSGNAVDIDSVDFTYSDDEFDDHLESLETLAASEKPNQELPAVSAQNKTEEPVDEKELDEMEKAARLAKEMRKSLAERREQAYVSKFESQPAAAPAPSKKPDHRHSFRNEKQEERKPVLKKKPAFTAMQPIYTEDELAEIEENELEEELSASWNEDVDYEEYDEYYDDEF